MQEERANESWGQSQQMYLHIVHQSLVVKQIRVHGGLAVLQYLRALLMPLLPQQDFGEGVHI